MSPHHVKQRHDAFGARARMQKIALDAERLQGVGLVPDEALGDAGGVDVERRDIGGAPSLAFRHKALKASSHRDILAGKAPDRLAAEAGVFVETM